MTKKKVPSPYRKRLAQLLVNGLVPVALSDEAVKAIQANTMIVKKAGEGDDKKANI